MCVSVNDLQSGVSDVHCRTEFASVSTAVDVLSTPDDGHIQIRRQQKSTKNQLSHIHGE